jgi:hypothetical protein
MVLRKQMLLLNHLRRTRLGAGGVLRSSRVSRGACSSCSSAFWLLAGPLLPLPLLPAEGAARHV